MWISEKGTVLCKSKRGYLTVEASFLLPLTLGILFLVIYFSFYCFDRCASLQNAYLVSLRASNQWEAAPSAKEEYAKKEWEDLTNSLFIFLENKELQINADREKVELDFSGEIKNTLWKVFQLGPDNFTFSESMEARTIYPAKYIRKCDRWRDSWK